MTPSKRLIYFSALLLLPSASLLACAERARGRRISELGKDGKVKRLGLASPEYVRSRLLQSLARAVSADPAMGPALNAVWQEPHRAGDDLLDRIAGSARSPMIASRTSFAFALAPRNLGSSTLRLGCMINRLILGCAINCAFISVAGWRGGRCTTKP